MSLSIANESIPVINVPIYVIGPAILTQELTSIGINQSLIKPITINQLAGLPNGSVAVIDWPLVRPSIVVSDPGGKVEVNLTSPVIRELINATARGGDVIGIYANASDEDVVEFILAYSWARAVNNELVLVGADFREEVPDYLTAYPIIPVSGKEPVIFVVRWVKPRGLIIGPIYANQLTQLIVNIMRPTISLNAVNGVIDTVDPCYAEYQQYNGASNPSPSVYSTNSSTLIWAAPMWTSTSYSGIQAYSDDNGSFYWDTCLDLSNSINEEQLSGYGPTYYLTANVIGYESYFESSTMYDNGGFEVSQVGGLLTTTQAISNTVLADPMHSSAIKAVVRLVLVRGIHHQQVKRLAILCRLVWAFRVQALASAYHYLPVQARALVVHSTLPRR